MIQRIVLVKLNAAYAAERHAIATYSRRQLARVPQVRRVSVGVPADEAARGAWDLSLVVELDSLADVTAYVDHPTHRSYVDGYLRPRATVLKFWNFEADSTSGLPLRD